jgi:hypothetical protein
VQATIDFDARKLFEAIKYQIHVAIDYCHTLEDDESLWIEVFGDVAVGQWAQVEVKLWSDDLTDGHTNFWNTLNNWLKPEFDHDRFKNLVLLTNQDFGARSELCNWNDISPKQRLGLLLKIQARLSKPSQAKTRQNLRGGVSTETREKRSKSAVQRALILSEERRETLLSIIPKIRIVTQHDNLLALLSKYKRAMLRSVNPTRKDDFLNDLFGFMMDAERINNGWEIKGSEFTAKFLELMKRYMVGAVTFPTVDKALISRQAAEVNVSLRLFAQKLNQIGAGNRLVHATSELLQAQEYLAEMINDCAITQEESKRYQVKHHDTHYYKRARAMRNFDSDIAKTALMSASHDFYLDRCGDDVEPFCAYQDTPLAFRNGIYHILADEPAGTREDEFHWRLWDE